MNRLSLLFIFIFSISFNQAHALELKCSNYDLTKKMPKSVWFDPKDKPKSVTLVVHGLNLLPEKMDSISNTLVDDGSKVFRIALEGHRGSEEEFKKVDREKWLLDLHRAYCEARAEADQLNVPLNFAGFSLGGVLNIDLMNSYPDANVHYDHMLLFAPAIVINSKSYLIKILSILGPRYVVPSLADEDYRANCAGTPIAAYQALFKSIGAVEKSGIKQKKTPTLIIVDDDDEMVSAQGLQELIDLNELEWSMYRINKDSKKAKGAHHLIIDEQSVGTQEWAYIQKQMKAFLTTKEISEKKVFDHADPLNRMPLSPP